MNRGGVTGLRGVILAAVLLAGGVLPAFAARYHVSIGGTRTSQPSEPGDWAPANCYPTLALAVASASVADSVLLDLQVHELAASVTLTAFLGNRALSATASDAEVQFTAAGALTSNLAAAVTRLQGITLRGGEAQSLPALRIADADAALELAGCDFLDFTAAASGSIGGSALRATLLASLTATDCRFNGNHTTFRGGALYLGPALNAEFTGCQWVGNSALGGTSPQGGAIMVVASAALSTLVFRECEFRDNQSGSVGGTLSSLSASFLFEDCVVTGSRSHVDPSIDWGEGAGLHMRRDASDHTDPVTSTARSCYFENNQVANPVGLSSADGGAFYVRGADSQRLVVGLVEDCTFVNNFSLWGAGTHFARFAEGTVRRCRFYDNTAYFQGGGALKGGASYQNNGETLVIENCLFVRNQAGYLPDGSAGGSYSLGGAVLCRQHPRVEVRHCTFVDNRVRASGWYFGDAFAHYFESGSWLPSQQCVLQNCVFWGTGGNHVQIYSSSGGMAAVEHCAYEPGEISIGSLEPLNPVLLDAVPYESLETGFPLADGPLIDAGLEIGVDHDLDQRPRPVGGGPDIGCYEVPDTTPVEELPGTDPGLTVGPNPFNPRTTLTCRLAAGAHVALVIHDPQGRRVRTLWHGELPAGRHAWTWDGRDEDGRGCAAGVYLVRFAIDGHLAAARKLALVR